MVSVWIGGIGIGIALSSLFYVEKKVTVTFHDDGKYTYESNVNRDGDKYFIIFGKDTVARSEYIDGWR